ncbi:hypothetical protein FKW77_005634 [Venturia effusa]|uniref:glucan endo-1,3-beta-D-glucosidase n=1 Tax=Venturia effusa TaxID=50376 RepID=A0A517KWF8_9PEZI|nr:hypothetical protein FKW77_005634 [Venturia effusa]
MSKFTPFLLLSSVAATGNLINGNWYAASTERLAYHGLGGAGAYNEVVNMDSATGTCSKATRTFSGPLAPFDEDVSLHFRGPLVLRQFAAYKPTQGTPRRTRRSDHADFVENQKLKRAVGDKVVATINGQVVSWTNQYDGGAPALPAAPTITVTAGCGPDKRAVGDMVVATINGDVVSWVNTYDGRPAPAPTQMVPVTVTVAGSCPDPAPAAPTAAPPVPAPAEPAPPPAPDAPSQPAAEPATLSKAPGSSTSAFGDWVQVAYFNSDEKRSSGITFLNNRGGQGSGVWDTKFGNSLSYASADGKSGTASPELFGGSLDSGLDEIAIFSDVACEKSGDCGYSRPGAVAYKGFAGAQKAFFFEFQMPDDGTSGWNQNMPAIWALNAKIPRTQQYGACSCWDSGCGEFDILEVLDPGNTRCKSTVHGFVQGGSSNYFVRPTVSFKKMAVIFNNDNVMIRELPDDFDFSAGISTARITELADFGVTASSVFSFPQ